MNKPETSTKPDEAAEPSRAKTILWLMLGVLVYFIIQWMLPKVGMPS